MIRFNYTVIFLTILIPVALFSCQNIITDHVDLPPANLSIQSATLVEPTSPGAEGRTLSVQAGNQYFLLDSKGAFWQYFANTNSFQSKATIAITDFNRGDFSAVDLFQFASTDYVYIGGQSKTSTVGSSGGFPNFFWIYNVQQDKWTKGTPCPGSGQTLLLNSSTSFFLNGKGYVYYLFDTSKNGTQIDDEYAAECYEFDPLTGQWSTLFKMLLRLPRTLITFNSLSDAVVVGNKAYWLVNAIPKAKRGQSLQSGDRYVCLFEFDSVTKATTLKLTTNIFSDSNYLPLNTIKLALSAKNQIWFLNNPSIGSNQVPTNMLINYNPANNVLTNTQAKVITDPSKALYYLIGFAGPDKLYVGLGEYNNPNATPAGSNRAFATFTLP